jgi:subtilisin family serine protease
MRRLVFLLVSLGFAVVAASASSTTAGTPLSPKLRGDLAALVAGQATLDARIPELIPGLEAGEIPFFAVLSESNDLPHRTQLEGLGARVLRTYRSVDAFALVSDAGTVSEVAALPWVDWLAPIEVVEALTHEAEVGEVRNTPADVGAHQFWDADVTGGGVRIAVLDTGLDPLHQDLDDLDFRHWIPGLAHPPLVNDAKVVDSRDFNGGVCRPPTVPTDGSGHGTHVAGIALGTGEGNPLDALDNGKHAGVAPGAELAVGKALTDAGAGVNSDLIAAMEWAAMPEEPRLTGCAIGADIVNMSLGSEGRPDRLNSGQDRDLVSLTLNRLAVKYGTLFVGAAGNSGPFMGSSLEAPGSAAQVLSVAAAAKDYDLRHDDTLSGDTCAGWVHDEPPTMPAPLAAPCGANPSPLQPQSLANFSSRGSGATWLRPDIAGPGYYVVSAQASGPTAVSMLDVNPNTQPDPLYATASGTSMATPAVAGSAALVLEAYRDRYGEDPTGASGLSGFQAPAYVLLRAALMNTAGSDLYEGRLIVTTPFGSLKVDPRNGPADPYVGPLAEGAGKVNAARAVAALRDGVVVYSAASGSGVDRGTGARDLQGSWQVGAIKAGASQTQTFVLHSAPGAPNAAVSFRFDPGQPSDGSRAIPLAPAAGGWTGGLGGQHPPPRDRDVLVRFTVNVPSSAAPGSYTGAVLASLSTGQTLRVPVYAGVALHDPNVAAGNAPGPQARVTSARDVYARDNTTWPSALGQAAGAQGDWLVFPVELASGLTSATFKVYDSAAGDDDETYDLYLYDAGYDLEASTHPFLAPGVTDPVANDDRGPSTEAEPQVLTVANPTAGRHYVVVNRAKVGGLGTGDFGSFVLTLDEIRAGGGGGAEAAAATAATTRTRS